MRVGRRVGEGHREWDRGRGKVGEGWKERDREGGISINGRKLWEGVNMGEGHKERVKKSQGQCN